MPILFFFSFILTNVEFISNLQRTEQMVAEHVNHHVIYSVINRKENRLNN